jgi:hypothetical protein
VNFTIARRAARATEFATVQLPIDVDFIGGLVEGMLSTNDFMVEVGDVSITPVGVVGTTAADGTFIDLEEEAQREVLNAELRAQIESVLAPRPMYGFAEADARRYAGDDDLF